jgi:hypothetical protein
VRIHLLAALSVCVCVAACGPPSFDASSDESIRESIARVRASLPDGQRKEFDEAFLVVAMHGLSPQQRLSGTVTPESIAVLAKEQLAGKTAEQIIEEANRLRVETETSAREAETKAREKAREEARVEIAKLEERRAAVQAAKSELVKFQILESRFSQVETREGPEPVIVLTVLNGTSYPVSNAFFVGSVTSPDRSVPWITEEFNYDIPGGLEPGERATWRPAPNDPFSTWKAIRPGKDAMLQVEVIALQGPDGTRLFTDLEFNQGDAARLASLKSKYGL